MTTTIKVLGQLAPSATTLTTLYTVPASTSTVTSSLVVCNRDPLTATTFRVAIRPAGEVIADKHYLYYNIEIPAEDTFVATLGMTLATTDVVSVYVGAATVSFTLFGEEASP